MNVNQAIYLIGAGSGLLIAVAAERPVPGFFLLMLCAFNEIIRLLTHIANGTRA